MKTSKQAQIARFSLRPPHVRFALANTRRQSKTAYRCSHRYNPGLRYLLKTTDGWLADHTLVDDHSHLITHDQKLALRFTDFEQVCTCGGLLMELFPDLKVQAVQFDSIHGHTD